MNYVEKLFDEVHYAFNLNAATLSGAIDILVIPQLDGTLKCTPFHVRFGKLQLIQSSAKVISIYVNGQKTELQMKLGQAGEAFFVEESDEPVPDILATSPIPSPKSGRKASSTTELVSEIEKGKNKQQTSTTTTTTTFTTTASSSSTSLGTTSTTLATTHTISSTTSSPINSNTIKFTQHKRDSFDSKELKPLTSALEEIILQQQQQQQFQSNNNSTTIIPQPQIKKTTSPLSNSRPSSPVTVESQSPIGSYIIDCGEHVTPFESPSSSPPKGGLASVSTTTTTTTTTSTSEPSSDSESEPKFWRWGGFPKFNIRRKQIPQQQQQLQPQKQQQQQQQQQQQHQQHQQQQQTTTIDISHSTTTTTNSNIISIPPNSDSNDNNNSNRIEEIIDLPPPPANTSLLTSEITSSNNNNNNNNNNSDNNNISEPVSPIINSSIRSSIGSDDGLGVPIIMSSNDNQHSIPIPTPNNTPSNPSVILQEHQSLENNHPSSWTRMGSLLKMFKKDQSNQGGSVGSIEIQDLSSGDELLSSSSSSSSKVTQGFIVNSSTTSKTTTSTSSSIQINTNESNNNGSGNGDDNMFLLDEEQEEQEKKEQQQEDQQQQEQQQKEELIINSNLSYAQIVKEGNEIINHQQPSNDKSKGTTVISTLNPPSSSIAESLSKLNYESEYPTLQHSQYHHTHHNHQSQQNSLIDHFSISLSLCGHLILDKALQSEPEEKEAFFIEYLISFEHFCSDPTLLKNPHLVAKINDHYYPWSIAGHIILSYLIYRRPITQEALNNLKKKDIEDRLQIGGNSNNSGSNNKSIESNASNANNTATTAITNQNQQPPTKQSSYWRGWLWKNSNNNNNVQNQQQQQISPSSSPPSSFNTSTGIPIKSDPIPFSNNNSNPLSLSSGSIPLSNIVIEDMQRKFTKKTLRPTSDQLKSLGLKKGINRITFVVSSTLLGTKEVSASIYLWDNTSKIVISDIDGTITKSDVFGQVLPLIGKDWSHIGVAELYSNIKANGYQIIYLTSRAIGQANLTRTYISSVKQAGSNQNSIGGAGIQGIPFTLPEGPVFMSPNRLLTSFNREVIRRNPEEFKIACLQDIQNIFPTTMSPFYAGFGNRNTDAISYNAVGVPKGKTFTINPLGVINTTNTTYNKTYTKINELVQDMFPCQNANKNSVDEQWNEYHYWKKSVIPLHKLDPL